MIWQIFPFKVKRFWKGVEIKAFASQIWFKPKPLFCFFKFTLLVLPPRLHGRRENTEFSGFIVEFMKNRRTVHLLHATRSHNHKRHFGGHHLWDCSQKALLPVFLKYKQIISFSALSPFQSSGWRSQVGLFAPFLQETPSTCRLEGRGVYQMLILVRHSRLRGCMC